MTSDNKKVYNLKGASKYVLSFFLTILFLYIAFRNVNFYDVLNSLKNVSFFWVLIFIIIFLLSHVVRAYRWKIILKSVKPDAKFKNLFGALMVGYGMNCVIPRLGEVTRAVLIGKWEGLSKTSMFGTVILERIIDILFFGISIIITIFISTKDVYQSFPWLKLTLYISTAFLLGIIIFIIFLFKFKDKFSNIIISFISLFSSAFAQRAHYIFEMLLEGFSSLRGVTNYLYTIFLSAVIILLYALNSYIGFYTLNMQHFQNLDFGMGWVVMSISSIGVAIPTPGGTGSYHALVKETLVLLYGFGNDISSAYAILTHFISYILFIIFALIIFFVLNKKHESLIKIVKSEI